MRIPKLIIPVLVVVALLAGYFLRMAFTMPTTNVSFAATGGKTAVFVVDGLKCKGTAGFFTRLYQNRPGIAAIETFATEHKAVFTYDPAITSPDSIRAIMEAPIRLRDGSERQVFRCVSMR
ncbi:heavy-metal-associated domain-containing protein [bacterium]|nr:heavy-metal-associated domain-containing protein [bacterium]MBU1985105.1 heavy-metal-associated domain-containing protein [bacterium]